jgi:cystathionine beta-lyase
MPYDFDEVIDRRSTNSIKWQLYGPQVLPLWVADMDFRAPELVRRALQAAVEHGIFGYDQITRELRQLIASRMEKLYQWQVSPESIVPTPGVIAGFTAATRTVCSAGEGVLIQPPVYPPFLSVHSHAGLISQQAQLRCVEQGHLIRYEIDWDVLQETINSVGTRSAMFG